METFEQTNPQSETKLAWRQALPPPQPLMHAQQQSLIRQQQVPIFPAGGAAAATMTIFPAGGAAAATMMSPTIATPPASATPLRLQPEDDPCFTISRYIERLTVQDKSVRACTHSMVSFELSRDDDTLCVVFLDISAVKHDSNTNDHNLRTQRLLQLVLHTTNEWKTHLLSHKQANMAFPKRVKFCLVNHLAKYDTFSVLREIGKELNGSNFFVQVAKSSMIVSLS